MTAPTWAEFREAMFGPPYEVWHDGAAFETIVARWQVDRAFVERMLLVGLSEHDPLAAQTVRELPLDDAARQRLATVLGAIPASGSMAVETGASLAHLTGDEDHAAQVAAVLTGEGHWGTQLDAARTLALFAPTEALIHALEVGLANPDYLVRYHSANTLLAFAGVADPDISASGDDFGIIVDADPALLADLIRRYGAAARARLTI